MASPWAQAPGWPVSEVRLEVLIHNCPAGDYLLESGMVVVSINYRLGPLGFLALPGTNIQVGNAPGGLHSWPG